MDPQRGDLTTDPTIPGEPLVDPDVEADLATTGAFAPPDLATSGAAPPEAAGFGSGDPNGGGDGGGKASQVKEAATGAAGDVASTAGDQAKRVTSEAADQARSVVQEVKDQAGGLAGQAGDELRRQAETRASDAATAAHTFADRLQALSEGRPGDAGPLAGYLDEARGQISNFASRLDSGGLDGVMSDVSGFARRRPGLFLLAAAGAGFFAGRLVRSGKSAASGDGGSEPYGQLAPTDGPIVTPAMPAQPAMPTPVTTGVSIP